MKGIPTAIGLPGRTILAFVLWASGAGWAPLTAQTLTGGLEPVRYPSYAGIASHFMLSDARAAGETIYDGELRIFSSNLSAKSIDEQERVWYPYELTADGSPLRLGSLDTLGVWDQYLIPQDIGLAQAQVHWFVDQHYESAYLNGDETSQYAFQNVLWELYGDGGTDNGLSFWTGNIIRSKFSSSGFASAPELWDEMNLLLESVENAGVTSEYVPVYQILAVHDIRSGFSDYIGLASTPEMMNAVPEPRVAILFGCAALLLLSRRGRNRRGRDLS